MISSALTSVTAATPLQTFSEALVQSFYITLVATNPGVTTVINHINVNQNIRSIFFDRVVIYCTSACQMVVVLTTTGGTGCTVQSALINAMNTSPNPAGSFANASNGCTGLPATAGTNILSGNLTIPANTLTSIDLRGFICTTLTTTGIAVIPAVALTGTVTATFFWNEK